MRKNQINPNAYTITNPARAAQALDQWNAGGTWDELVAQLTGSVAR